MNYSISRKQSLIICLSLFLWLSCLNVNAQQPQLQFLQSLSGMNAEKMSYCYKVYMVNRQSAAILDSVAGVLYRDKMYYLDSNALVINMRDADYTLQLNPQDKTAYVKFIKVILAKMKGKQPEPYSLFDAADLQKRKIISLVTDKTVQGNTHLKVAFDEPDIDEIEMEVTPSNTLAKLVLKIPAGGVDKDARQRVLVMYNFTDQFSSDMITTSRFMTVKKETCKLKGKFATYTLQRLI